jgi:peptidoglycan lytic transglycosylase G
MSLSEVLPGFTPEPGQPPQRRRNAARQQRKRKKQKRRRSLLAIVVTFVVVVGGIGGAYLGLAPLVRQLTEPNDYTGTGTGTATVKIPDGASGRDIARVLTEAGVTKTPVAFIDAAKKDTRSGRIQPGTYELHRQMSGVSALALLLDPKSRSRITLTVPEGRRAIEIYSELQQKLGFSRAELTKAAKADDLGLPRAAHGRVEGYLFPATYDFQPDVTPEEALQAMVERGKATFDELGIPDTQLHDVVVKASIVQAEAGRKEYMGKVARVLDNRLDQGMKLQLDSTVSYATGKFEITTTPKDRASTSPYNTYRYAGLPPGPISNPGEDALRAALEPADGQWLFFVTVNPKTGETKFADTAAQHSRYVDEFRAWLRANP